MSARALIDYEPPEWVTPEIARRMADMVVMACAEAGYAEVIAYPSSLFDEVVSYSFAGAPDEVLYKAGRLGTGGVWHRSIMTTPTIHGAEHDLAVVREVRDRILAGDWTQGRWIDDCGRKCLGEHLIRATNGASSAPPLTEALAAIGDGSSITTWNDTHTQAEVVALLDDVEDSLLGELGVVG